MFNFNIVLAGVDVVTDTDKASTCRLEFKTAWLRGKSTKKQRVFWNNLRFSYNYLKNPDSERENLYSLHCKTTQRNTLVVNLIKKTVAAEKNTKTWNKLSYFNCFETWGTPNKNSSLYSFNFCIILAGHDMVTDICRATTCRCEFKAPLLQRSVWVKDFPKKVNFQQKINSSFHHTKKTQKLLFAMKNNQQEHIWWKKSRPLFRSILKTKNKSLHFLANSSY